MHEREEINEAYEYIRKRTHYTPAIGIILGTGYHQLADMIEQPEQYRYADIPHFPVPGVAGHEGTLIIGRIQGKEVVVMKGRCHCYEGYSPSRVTLPVRVMKRLGVETIIITNCSGQAGESVKAQDLFVIRNHLNFSGFNPLIGENLEEYGEWFPDLAYPYDRDCIQQIKELAAQEHIELKEGVYAMFSGPSYETVMETYMAARLGADIVGMSTIPEVIIANHCGMKVLALSGVPCPAAAYSDQEITHEQVMENCQSISDKAMILIGRFIKEL